MDARAGGPGGGDSVPVSERPTLRGVGGGGGVRFTAGGALPLLPPGGSEPAGRQNVTHIPSPLGICRMKTIPLAPMTSMSIEMSSVAGLTVSTSPVPYCSRKSLRYNSNDARGL